MNRSAIALLMSWTYKACREWITYLTVRADEFIELHWGFLVDAEVSNSLLERSRLIQYHTLQIINLLWKAYLCCTDRLCSVDDGDRFIQVDHRDGVKFLRALRAHDVWDSLAARDVGLLIRIWVGFVLKSGAAGLTRWLALADRLRKVQHPLLLNRHHICFFVAFNTLKPAQRKFH